MIKIIEGVFYQHPHFPELVASHPAMVGVWRRCVELFRAGAVMAPLLVDDRPQEGAICEQTVEGLLQATTCRNYNSFRWLGSQISEARLQMQHGTSCCASLYARYHMEVMQHLYVLHGDWHWTKVHPVSFQETNALALAELEKRLCSGVEGVISAGLRIKKEDFRAQARQSLLSRFSHQWVGENGRVVSHTRPVWKNGRVLHETIS